MDCCSRKETMPGPKEQPEGKGNTTRIALAVFLIIVLLGGLVLFFF